MKFIDITILLSTVCMHLTIAQDLRQPEFAESMMPKNDAVISIEVPALVD